MGIVVKELRSERCEGCERGERMEGLMIPLSLANTAKSFIIL